MKIQNLTNEELIMKTQEQITLLKNGLSSLNSDFSLKQLYKEFHKRYIFPKGEYKKILKEFNEEKISGKEFKEKFVSLCREERAGLGIII